MTEFVHLHNHSEYSLLDGIIRLSSPDGKHPSDLLTDLAKAGTKAIGLTDHGNMCGAIEFYDRCREVGLKPIVGCEMYIAKGTRSDRGHSQKENCHLTVLAKNYEGYQNLMELVSRAYAEGYYYDPRIDKELLKKHAKGLVVLSGCLKSEVCQLIDAGQAAKAEELCAWYRDVLDPESFYLEVMDHGIEKQKAANQALLEIGRRTGIPFAATNDCHYARRDDAEAQDARVCIATGKRLADTARLKFEHDEFYVKSPQQMEKLFSYLPASVKNTVKIAEMCDLKIPSGQILLPEFSVPEGFTQDSYLEKLCREGLETRFGSAPQAHLKRLGEELAVIRRMGFSSYFLIVWDFISFAKKNGVPVGPGRGSGAGSLVAYSLGITNLDPIEHKLLFERFLNPDRKSMPDLDIDFADTGREKVIDYVRRKYGETNVAQIITFGTMAARLAVRDVGRVLGIALSDTDRIAKLIPGVPGTTLEKALKESPELAEAARDPQMKKLFDLSKRLEGLKRHTSVHAAGIVITKEPVARYTPLAKSAKSDALTTQYEGETLSNLGLLKVDFLGLRTLSIIDSAVQLVRTRARADFDIDKIPMDDPATYELLRRAEALAVFQLDSPGIRDLLFRLKPSNFSDISALVALYRPGPMQSGMLDMFVRRKNGEEKIAYDHPLLESILGESYGCIVFQEQVMQIAKSLADFSPGDADALRKAMGKKIPEELEKRRDAFVKGAKGHSIAPKLANKIYDQLVQFGGYGFNKSHSAAYGLLAYQTAYLKANYPLEFMCAVATSEIGHSSVGAADKENKLVTYLEEARRMGIAVLPPDVQKSEVAFSIEEPKAIRFALMAVKNVGFGAAQAIVAARQAKAFESLDDFCLRVDSRVVNKKVLESLTKAGALDGLGGKGKTAQIRGNLLSRVGDALDRQSALREEVSRGQGLLFEMAGAPAAEAAAEDGSAQDVPALSEQDVLHFEKEVLGFYFTGHPLFAVREQLKAVASHQIEGLTQATPSPVRLAGLVTQVRKMTTKAKGEPWLKAVLEDLSGEITLLIFPRAYASGVGKNIASGQIVTASGRLSFKDAGAPAPAEGPDASPAAGPPAELIVDDVSPLENALARAVGRLRLRPHSSRLEAENLKRLESLLDEHPGPCLVVLEHDTPEGTALLETDRWVRLDRNLLESIEEILGEKSWVIENAS